MGISTPTYETTGPKPLNRKPELYAGPPTHLLLHSASHSPPALHAVMWAMPVPPLPPTHIAEQITRAQNLSCNLYTHTYA